MKPTVVTQFTSGQIKNLVALNGQVFFVHFKKDKKDGVVKGRLKRLDGTTVEDEELFKVAGIFLHQGSLCIRMDDGRALRRVKRNQYELVYPEPVSLFEKANGKLWVKYEEHLMSSADAGATWKAAAEFFPLGKLTIVDCGSVVQAWDIQLGAVAIYRYWATSKELRLVVEHSLPATTHTAPTHFSGYSWMGVGNELWTLKGAGRVNDISIPGDTITCLRNGFFGTEKGCVYQRGKTGLWLKICQLPAGGRVDSLMQSGAALLIGGSSLDGLGKSAIYRAE